ncbi:DUF262 domain-containing protein [Aerococcaceae bacterium DSM 109653]|uniref:DUF262 domain-containing protein n=1 Tax=Fundicoccus ignavus TaxID=2664442 RepID=A0A844C1X0_9LACT|nr:DUF262 domain-containing protein [Fundicoccus ignavus]MRI82696.1 DUF262 domain-containing protein [Fundicoccus ignavus]
MSNYNVNNYTISTLLGWIRDGQVAIPEIQRPFVWKKSKVRDLIDSLFKNYPVGYIITWKNPDVRLKDGSLSQGKNILIDGQQRVTALMAAISGEPVIDHNYSKGRITIAFNPKTRVFEVSNAAIIKDEAWIPDISALFKPDFSQYQFIMDYCEKHPDVNPDKLNQRIQKLINIKNNQIGIIELNSELGIDTVNQIFVRINSQGTSLSQSDFVMSKIAVNNVYNGPLIRKTIDYFANVIQTPSNLQTILNNDSEFTQSDYFHLIKWVTNYESSVFLPKYNDIIRVIFAVKFKRGRMSDLVSLLSGRNFETRGYEDRIIQETFTLLDEGLKQFLNEINFKRFCMIIKSIGVVDKKMITSQNNINFAYALFLLLREKGYADHIVQKVVRKWYVLATLTGKYSSSPESQIDFDIKRFNEQDPEVYLHRTEQGELGDSYWETILPDNYNTNSIRSPYFNVFLMAQVFNKTKAFLSDKITVQQLLEERGDLHHIFPKNYLVKNGFKQNQYNQLSNYVYAEQPINIRISNHAPKEYLGRIMEQIKSGQLELGEIQSIQKLEQNFKENAIPLNLIGMDIASYNDFLNDRRQLMSEVVRLYYNEL